MTEIAVTASPPTNGNIYAIIGQQIPASRLDEATKNPDALKIAYDVGVLELLSLSLTLFAIVLAIAAVFGFWMIRGAALRAARDAAKAEVKEIATTLAKEWIEENAKSILAQSAKAVSGSTTPTIEIDAQTQAEVIADAEEVKP
jgi:hypothetical protein